MAKRRRGGVNKSQAIREYMKDNSAAKPKDVVAALAEKGIKVSAGTVSTLLSNDRRKLGQTKRRGRKPGKAAGGGNFDALVQASKLVKQLGGVDAARQALDALARILD